MRRELGLLLNLASFVILAAGNLWVAAPLYAASIALLLIPQKIKKEEKKEEVRKEPTPDEIKRRPVAAPEI
ncbi:MULTISPECIES: hypothetical protein [Pyrobaculum]|uniref:Uncharacterized protein n=2 Tax=Pyrobaculum arsenaticum TaxID=121277 RepID=A4WKH1_PYRAR|nr:hypothetical protein [Pyrobaculum arsenaticum]ABP50888.1 conserved hypothetical protein [Pyrobaculum arsenaticum DSM 13514]MCY0891324.1 hypothetical protein [Pyrobaculum arsenaticum]NYR15393.1 hypothetical protein [Pyrobaculum arsenaticum]